MSRSGDALIETAGDAATFTPKDPNNLAFVTQTTLSIDDTAEIVEVLLARIAVGFITFVS